MLKKSLKLFFAALLISSNASAQIVVENTLTPEELVQDILLGSGITATNIWLNGSPANAMTTQVGASYFNALGTAFPVERGVLLTTGAGTVAIGPNDATGDSDAIGTLAVNDVDLTAISTNTPTNGVVLEFDFVATGDTLSFNYMFGSEEYPEFSPSSWNDAFGFFLSGPGLAGPYSNGGVNIAQIPGGLPVTINNINPTTNPTYYVDNTAGLAYGTAIQYDGTTIALTASSQLQCGGLYHIKMAICNAGDQALDSGVFLEAESFSSNLIAVETTSTFSGSFTDTLLAEGCTSATLNFIRPADSDTVEATIPLYVSGSADTLADLNGYSGIVHFPIGVDTVSLSIDPADDGIDEPMEIIEIGFYNITSCGDSIYDSVTFYIVDNYEMTHDMPDTVFSECIANIDSIEITNFAGSIPPYSVSWEFGSTDNPSAIPPSSTSQSTVEYIVEMMDGCGDLFYDTLTYITNQTLDITNLMSNNSSSCASDGWVSATIAGETGTPLLHWTGPGNPGTNNVDGSVMQNLPSGWYFFSVIDDVCSFDDSIFVDVDNPPIAEFSASIEGGCNPLTVNFTNTSQNTSNYTWDFGDGTATSNSFEPSHTFTQSSTVTLTAFTDDPTCFDETTIDISIANCGCTDPEAVNYDPAAVVDNGDCIYPIPSVTGPNVFTPNNDNDNDVFFLTHQNATSITLTVLNRWGNVMHESTTDLTDPMARAEWDGKTKGGINAEEGTYFYKYVAIGVDGSEIEGHGFVQLLP